jgi:hypothetical protein
MVNADRRLLRLKSRTAILHSLNMGLLSSACTERAAAPAIQIWREPNNI